MANGARKGDDWVEVRWSRIGRPKCLMFVFIRALAGLLLDTIPNRIARRAGGRPTPGTSYRAGVDRARSSPCQAGPG